MDLCGRTVPERDELTSGFSCSCDEPLPPCTWAVFYLKSPSESSYFSASRIFSKSRYLHQSEFYAELTYQAALFIFKNGMLLNDMASLMAQGRT